MEQSEWKQTALMDESKITFPLSFLYEEDDDE